MHIAATLEIVKSVRRRIAQGDHPTEPAFSVETLEHVVDELARENAALRADAERLRTVGIAARNLINALLGYDTTGDDSDIGAANTALVLALDAAGFHLQYTLAPLVGGHQQAP